jgi:hypothetical protein
MRITNAYNLPLNNGELDSQRVGGWVEINLTRPTYWQMVMSEHSNSNGNLEVVFKVPFLYYGVFAVGVEDHGACY